MAWTDEDVETLKSMWTAGAPALEIAAQLGGDKGKNAVVGKAHRLGLPARGNPTDTGDLFERLADLVIDPPYLPIKEACRGVGLSEAIGRRVWRMTIEATHGGDPA